MGVEGLSKLVKPVREVKLQDFKNCTFAIDAYVQMYRAFKSKVVLTNKNGEKTHHISSILSMVLKLESYGIKQIWVFDHDWSKDADPDEHSKFKIETIRQRAALKAKNAEKLWLLKQKAAALDAQSKALDEESKKTVDDLFSGIDQLADINKEIRNAERIVADPRRKEANDIKMILDCLGIEWVEAPITYEGEAICADLVKMKIADYAFTPDLDALMFGAPRVIKQVGYGKDTKFMLYDLDHVIEDLEIGYEDLIKIGLCLGTDYNPDGIPKIGIKTVLARFRNATDWRAHPYDLIIGAFARTADINTLKFNNISNVRFTADQQKSLIRWLVDAQNFDEARITKQFSNALDKVKIGEIRRGPPSIEIQWNEISS